MPAGSQPARMTYSKYPGSWRTDSASARIPARSSGESPLLRSSSMVLPSTFHTKVVADAAGLASILPGKPFTVMA